MTISAVITISDWFLGLRPEIFRSVIVFKYLWVEREIYTYLCALILKPNLNYSLRKSGFLGQLVADLKNVLKYPILGIGDTGCTDVFRQFVAGFKAIKFPMASVSPL